MTAGRPSLYTEELGNRICQMVAEGLSFRQIESAEGMPSRYTILNWIASNEQFLGQYRRAKIIAVESYLDEAAEIADDGTNDFVETEKGDAYNGEHVQRSKLRVETRLRLASLLAPKIYGPKVAHDHTGTLTLESLLTGDGAK